MPSFNLTPIALHAPIAPDFDTLLFGDTTLAQQKQWHSWQAFVYDAVILSKELIKHVDESEEPIYWLLPALEFQNDIKSIFKNTFEQVHKNKQQHFIFRGADGINSAIEQCQTLKHQKAYMLSIDATYQCDALCQLNYVGINGACAVYEQTVHGFIQQLNQFEQSVDLTKDHVYKRLFKTIKNHTQDKINTIFAPNDGITEHSTAWLNDVNEIASLFDEAISYELLIFKVGHIGSLLGLTQMIKLMSKNDSNHKDSFLLINSEQGKYAAATLYTWNYKDLTNNG